MCNFDMQVIWPLTHSYTTAYVKILYVGGQLALYYSMKNIHYFFFLQDRSKSQDACFLFSTCTSKSPIASGENLPQLKLIRLSELSVSKKLFVFVADSKCIFACLAAWNDRSSPCAFQEVDLCFLFLLLVLFLCTGKKNYLYEIMWTFIGFLESLLCHEKDLDKRNGCMFHLWKRQ